MELVVAEASSFTDPGRRIFDIEGVEIAVFCKRGQFHAYENVCPHFAGPACQGKVLPLTLEDVQPNLTSDGRVFSKDRTHVVCPWHGMEFDIETGEHPLNKRIRLKRVPVRVEGDDVYVTLPRSFRDHVAPAYTLGDGESQSLV